MDVKVISGMGKELAGFLEQFGDCFSRSEPRAHLRAYVSGQLSDLPRKSVEPIALRAGTPPRTLQYFFSSAEWNEPWLCDRLQRIVARDHTAPEAIGIIDESGNPKKGRHTAGVKRQWCGATGKIDNCVVGVHLAYVAGAFHCLLDSDLYLPREWAEDGQRRREVGVPDDVPFRKKTAIALAQVGRALSNGLRVAAWTFDEFYGADREFLDGLEAFGQNYVGEVPATVTGWLREPKVLQTPTPAQRRKRGPTPRFPRLARKASRACEARNLVRHSRTFQKQAWRRYRIRDGEKGPMVWEVKWSAFYRRQGPEGLPGPRHGLIVARNVLNPSEVKYFVSNRVPGQRDVTLEWLLRVAFSRWPIERCFEVAKDEIGMDHFEMRSWRGVHRHWYISQLTQLFCARVRERLREKKRAAPLADGGSGPRGRVGVPGGPTLSPVAADDLRRNDPPDPLPPTPQRGSQTLPYPHHRPSPPGARHRPGPPAVLCAAPTR